MMEESNKQELIKFLNIYQHLGQSHLKTLDGFTQKPVMGGFGGMQSSPGGNDVSRISQQFIYGLMQTLDRATDDMVDDIIMLVTKQLRGGIDQNEIMRAQNIAQHLTIPLESLDAIGKLYQAMLVFESIAVHLQEDHISKITDALVSVFPVQSNVGDMVGDINQPSLDLQVKQQNYLIILQKLQQLFTTTRIDSLLHLHQEMNNGLQLHQNNHLVQQQQICETLELKSDEYFLATSLKSLLLMEETSLLTLIDAFPKLKSLQLAQLSQLPFKNIYEILDLRSNLCSFATTYGYYNQTQVNFTFALPDPTVQATIKILEQPPEKAVYKRNVKPAPSVMFDGDSKLLDGSYYVGCTLLRCNNFQEDNQNIVGNRPIQITSSKVVSFKKLKILVTSHQQGETLFCFKFELRRYRGDIETHPNDYDVLSSIHSNPICLLSHSTQLKHTAAVDLPQVVEAIPLGGPSVGGTRVAILGSNFADTPATRIKFDNAEVPVQVHSQGTILCYAPEHAPGTVQVRVSNAPRHWSSSFANYIYEDQRDIDLRNAREQASLHLPKSNFGLDFSSTFSQSFVIKGNSNTTTVNPPSVSSGRNNNNMNTYSLSMLDARGYSLLHYMAVFGELDECKSLFSNVFSPSNLANVVANLHVLDKYGNSPLFWAATFNSLSMVKALLLCGASVHVQNNKGMSPLHAAVSGGNVEMVRAMLQASKCHSINQCDVEGVSPLHMASMSCDLEMMSLLLLNNADIYAVDQEGETPLHYAVRSESVEGVRLLLQVAASKESTYKSNYSKIVSFPFELVMQDEPLHSIQNEDGETPLHLAVCIGNCEIAHLLVMNGAASNILDANGETALHIHISKIKSNNLNVNATNQNLILNLLCQQNGISNNIESQPTISSPPISSLSLKETILYTPKQSNRQILKYLEKDQSISAFVKQQNDSFIQTHQHQFVSSQTSQVTI